MSVRDEIVTMNIGGCIFSTSLQTLRQDPDSMLARMFSGHELSLTRDAQGNIFIDRDGTHFRYILNYLRSGHVPNLPPAVRKELLIEADFYQIRGLVNALRGSSTGSPDGVDMLEFGPLWLANGTVEAVKQKYGQKYNEIRAAVLQKCKQAMAEGDVRTELYVYDIKQADCPMMDRIFQAVSWELRQVTHTLSFCFLATTTTSYSSTSPCHKYNNILHFLLCFTL